MLPLAIAALCLVLVSVVVAALFARGDKVEAATLTPAASATSTVTPDAAAAQNLPQAQPSAVVTAKEPPGKGKANGKIKVGKNPGKAKGRKR